MQHKGWKVYRYENEVIIVPLNDDKPHKVAIECWCFPYQEWHENFNIPMYIHNSADLREYEEAAHECFKRWLLNTL